MKGGINKMKMKNKYKIKNKSVEIYYSNKYGNCTIGMDKKDFNKRKKHTWCVVKDNNNFYSVTKINGHMIKMHRFLLNLKDKKLLVDHKNRNGLDNRRKNIRVTNTRINGRNRSISKNNTTGFTGVRKYKNSFIAQWFENDINKVKNMDMNLQKKKKR